MFHDNELVYGFYCGILYLTPKKPINIISTLITLTILLFNILLYIYLSINVSIRSSKNNGWITKQVTRAIQKLYVITGLFFLDLLQPVYIYAGSPRYLVRLHLHWKNPCSDTEFDFTKQCYQSCFICLEIY